MYKLINLKVHKNLWIGMIERPIRARLLKNIGLNKRAYTMLIPSGRMRGTREVSSNAGDWTPTSFFYFLRKIYKVFIGVGAKYCAHFIFLTCNYIF